ncbi:hypothetical protein EVAR_46746_1 [Eumeta japonica]|uniref:Uncharacterized protein n=1 Tax=Eumeta variegata TaxID=151549 RepID=A0A4C2ADY5_EUMVA|nr:hypothetical protein EVAR_46746_1 [Eumeta japonica]
MMTPGDDTHIFIYLLFIQHRRRRRLVRSRVAEYGSPAPLRSAPAARNPPDCRLSESAARCITRSKDRKQTDSTDVPTETYRKQNFHPAPLEGEWKSSMGKSKNHRNRKQGPTKQPTTDRNRGFRTREDIGTIMSILQVVRSAEVADLAAKFRKAKHGVDASK